MIMNNRGNQQMVIKNNGQTIIMNSDGMNIIQQGLKVQMGSDGIIIKNGQNVIKLGGMSQSQSQNSGSYQQNQGVYRCNIKIQCNSGRNDDLIEGQQVEHNNRGGIKLKNNIKINANQGVSSYQDDDQEYRTTQMVQSRDKRGQNQVSNNSRLASSNNHSANNARTRLSQQQTYINQNIQRNQSLVDRINQQQKNRRGQLVGQNLIQNQNQRYLGSQNSYPLEEMGENYTSEEFDEIQNQFSNMNINANYGQYFNPTNQDETYVQDEDEEYQDNNYQDVGVEEDEDQNQDDFDEYNNANDPFTINQMFQRISEGILDNQQQNLEGFYIQQQQQQLYHNYDEDEEEEYENCNEEEYENIPQSQYQQSMHGTGQQQYYYIQGNPEVIRFETSYQNEDYYENYHNQEIDEDPDPDEEEEEEDYYEAENYPSEYLEESPDMISDFISQNQNQGLSQQQIDLFPVQVFKEKKVSTLRQVPEKSVNNSGSQQQTGLSINKINSSKVSARQKIPSNNQASNTSMTGSKVLRSSSKKLTIEKETCPICLGDFIDGEQIMSLPCFHRFHLECSTHWLQKNSKCPLCKINLLSD